LKEELLMREYTKEERLRLKLWDLENRFKDCYSKCTGYGDDRKLFTNIYEYIEKSVKEFYQYDFESPMILIAFTEGFKKELEELAALETSLKARNMI
jgi:hypothetical protein